MLQKMFLCSHVQALRSTAETQAATLMKEIAHLSAGVEKVGRLNWTMTILFCLYDYVAICMIQVRFQANPARPRSMHLP
jgi:hypothetical protein